MARNALEACAGNAFLWGSAQRLGFADHRRLAYARAIAVRRRIIRALGTPVRVPTGPFSGMIFPDVVDRGGGWLPRVLGTYEKELAEQLERVIQGKPSLIIDIGCAEGYYAIGLAIRLPESRVDAYDIAASERAICERMAIANSVEKRVFVTSACTEQTLLAYPGGIRALILCDCEGAERDLITTAVAHRHVRSWFIVECHDFIHSGTSEHLLAILSQTHNCRLIHSVSDDEKALTYFGNDIADRESAAVRSFIYGEGRGCIMNWLVATPREM